MSDPFANLGNPAGNGTQPLSNLVTPTPTSVTNPTTSPTPITATPGNQPPPTQEEEVMQHILANLLLENHHGQFASAFELAGITMPHHTTLLSADELLTMKSTSGADLATPSPIGAINKKLWTGMQKVHDKLLYEMGMLMLPNEAWFDITHDDIVLANVAQRKTKEPEWEEPSFDAVMEESKSPGTPNPDNTSNSSSKPRSILDSVKRDIN